MSDNIQYPPNLAIETPEVHELRAEVERLTNRSVTCTECTKSVPLQEIYRCYDCKQPFCYDCIPVHFDLEKKNTLAEVERLTRERDMYEECFRDAITPIDRVFQKCKENPEPILPDYCQLGEHKFEAVVRLAEDYVSLRATLAKVEAFRNDGLAKYELRFNGKYKPILNEIRDELAAILRQKGE